jgi:hypothetical protein
VSGLKLPALSVFQDHDYHEWRPPANSKLPLPRQTREGLFFADRVSLQGQLLKILNNVSQAGIVKKLI